MSGDPNVFCRQCGVTDDARAKCDGCEELFPHDQLVHYDGEGVFCPECDEFIESGEDEEDYPDEPDQKNSAGFYASIPPKGSA